MRSGIVFFSRQKAQTGLVCTVNVRQLIEQKMQHSLSPNPLHLATTAQEMARKAEGREGVMFQKVALVCMGVMALASVTQVLHSLLRDLNRKEHHERSRG
jgi:hypothetical protein